MKYGTRTMGNQGRNSRNLDRQQVDLWGNKTLKEDHEVRVQEDNQGWFLMKLSSSLMVKTRKQQIEIKRRDEKKG